LAGQSKVEEGTTLDKGGEYYLPIRDKDHHWGHVSGVGKKKQSGFCVVTTAGLYFHVQAVGEET